MIAHNNKKGKGFVFMQSVWKSSVKMPDYPQLNKDIDTDVLIIGGGIAGILTAYMLQEKGIDCVVVEKDRICSKTTQNTT
ncbi:MAG: FAD-dependent oxidoreductase, partial [Eubacterium sp.]